MLGVLELLAADAFKLYCEASSENCSVDEYNLINLKLNKEICQISFPSLFDTSASGYELQPNKSDLTDVGMARRYTT